MKADNASITQPGSLLIVGTDAAGKDHIANIVGNMIREEGGGFEKRKRYLCGKKTKETTSSAKNFLELVLEKGFILLFPLLGFLMPWAMNILLKRDIQRFAQPPRPLIIVGHNCLRGLAFYWGHKYTTTDEIVISPTLEATLEDMRRLPNLHIIALDVRDEIRRQRIELRQQLGKADFFDLYMAQDSARSERIEHFLIWLIINYLDGQLLENNDLNDEEIRRQIIAGLPASSN